MSPLIVNNADFLYSDAPSCEVGDFNNDGLFDMIVSMAGGGIAENSIPMRLYLNEGTKESYHFSQYTEIDFGGTIWHNQYSVCESYDHDNDGDLDLLFSRTAVDGKSHAVLYAENIGTANSPQFATPDTVDITIDAKFNTEQYQGNRRAGIGLGDLNGDGKADLAIGSGSYGKCFQIYYNESKDVSTYPIYDTKKSLPCSVIVQNNTLTCNLPESNDIAQLEIFTPQGKRVMTLPIQIVQGKGESVLGNIAKGVYLVKISISHQSFIASFVQH